MTHYQQASDKPSRTLINYNTVRAAELKAIYRSILGDTTVQAIIGKFAHEKDENVKECVDFLCAIDMLDRGDDDRVVKPINEDIYPNLAFEAKVLYHLHQQDPPQDHLGRIQTAALGAADRSIRLDNLLPIVERELGLEYEFSWNMTKLRMWRSLSVQLGLISETNSRGLILSPTRALLFDLLLEHQQEGDTDDLYGALIWIEENFFGVFDTHTGTPTVHPAISDVLHNMEAEGVLTLRGMADAQNEVKLPESNHSPKPRVIKEYQIEDKQPESFAYQYPLAQFEQEIIQ